MVGLILAALLQTSLVPVATAAESGMRKGDVLVGLALSQNVSDRLSVGDIRPQPRGEVLGGAEIEYYISPDWSACVSGQVGGSWFDFNGFAVSGRIIDASWNVRGGVDRAIAGVGGTIMTIGLGVEYGEARSWLDNLTISQAGPRNHNVGGSARIGIEGPATARMRLYGNVTGSFYRGRADDETSGTEYRWLGRSLSFAIGLKYVAVRGRQ